jgi:hypothetical protein
MTRSRAAIVFAAVGLLAFRPVLTAGFAGDDWHFLTIIQRAPDARVAFTPFNGFTRPILALLYYANYRLFGLWSFPVHAVALAVHVFNAWLVYLLALRVVLRPNTWIAFGSGLVFLVFAGHSEAISWIAGLADALVVPFLLGSLVFFDRALEEERPARSLSIACAIGAAGLLAKETAIVLPALGLVWGTLRPRVPARQRLVRTAAFCAGTLIAPLAFLAFRVHRFGSVTGTYSTIASGGAQIPATFRMFMLRTILPPGQVPVMLWVRGLDLLLLAIGAALAIYVMARRHSDRRPLLLTAGCLLVSLAPAMPLSISLGNTQSERYIYLASVFSIVLLVWLIDRVLTSRVLVAAALALLVAGNWHYLARANREWVQGGALFRGIVDDLLELCHQEDRGTLAPILLLDMPDNIYRPFVVAPAVHPALRLLDPTVTNPEARVRIISVHETAEPQPVLVQRKGRVFHVDIGSHAQIVDGWPLTDVFTTVTRLDAHRYDISVRRAPERLVVAMTTGMHVRRVAELNGVPFGAIDLPPDGASCDGASLRFAGWALDDERVERVTIEPGGTAVWRPGTRPDVAKMFSTYPNAGGAGWDFELPCASLHSARGPVRVRVTAVDNRGDESELGTRTVVATSTHGNRRLERRR